MSCRKKNKCKNWKRTQSHLLPTAPAGYFCWSGAGVGDRSRLCLGAGMLLWAWRGCIFKCKKWLVLLSTLSLHAYLVVHLSAIPRLPFLRLENDQNSLRTLFCRNFLTVLLFPVVDVVAALEDLASISNFKGVAQSVVQALLEGWHFIEGGKELVG